MKFVRAVVWLSIGLCVLVGFLAAFVVVFLVDEGLGFSSRRFDDLLWWVIRHE